MQEGLEKIGLVLAFELDAPSEPFLLLSSLPGPLQLPENAQGQANFSFGLMVCSSLLSPTDITLTLVQGVSLTPLNDSITVPLPPLTLTVSEVGSNNHVVSKTVRRDVEIRLFTPVSIGHREAMLGTALIIIFTMVCYVVASHKLTKALTSVAKVPTYLLCLVLIIPVLAEER